MAQFLAHDPDIHMGGQFIKVMVALTDMAIDGAQHGAACFEQRRNFCQFFLLLARIFLGFPLMRPFFFPFHKPNHLAASVCMICHLLKDILAHLLRFLKRQVAQIGSAQIMVPHLVAAVDFTNLQGIIFIPALGPDFVGHPVAGGFLPGFDVIQAFPIA